MKFIFETVKCCSFAKYNYDEVLEDEMSRARSMNGVKRNACRRESQKEIDHWQDHNVNGWKILT
jgi:hypothetical protein